MLVLMESLSVLYPVDDIHRLSFIHSADRPVLLVDVHGMKCRQAEQFINNIINLAHGSFTMTVIHGYNHGTAISDMVRNKLANSHIAKRSPDKYNQGITYLMIA